MLKRSILPFILIFILATWVEAASPRDDFFYDTIMTKGAITIRKPDKLFDIKGFKEFSLLARLEGPSDAELTVEIRYGNDILIYAEKIVLNDQGWVNFAKVYPVHSPSVRISIPDLPTRISGDISVYAGR